MASRTETIVALSSGALPAAIAVIRLSGPHALEVVQAFAGRTLAPCQMCYTTFRDRMGRIIDNGYAVIFPRPRTATGEDCAELHLHGSEAAVRLALTHLTAHAGVRLAEPGEFTRRAVENGKMTLLGAEALADIIAAETESELRFAQGHATEHLEALYHGWREQLRTALALLEADIDFSDQDDVGSDAARQGLEQVRSLRTSLLSHRAQYRHSEIVRQGLDVVLVGPPNVGKSSLLNAMARREVAIVSEHAGTTRDLIEVVLDLGGYRVRLTDTAGLREASDPVEAIGVGKTRDRIMEADVVLQLSDQAAFSTLQAKGLVLNVLTKSDVAVDYCDPACDIAVSAHTQEGLANLAERLAAIAGSRVPSAGSLLPWQERHVNELDDAIGHLGSAIEQVSRPEIVAEHLRQASRALARLTGALDTDDLLDVLFSRFCIGK